MGRAPAKTAQNTEWPRWGRQGVGAVAVGLGLAVALQRHLFTSPSPGGALVAAAVLPWVLEALGVELPPSKSPPAVRVALYSAVVMGATLGLILGYRINTDF